MVKTKTSKPNPPRARRARTEDELRIMLSTKVTHGYLSEEAYKKAKAVAIGAGGWNTVQYEGWLAREIQQGKVKIMESNPRVGTKEARERRIEIAEAEKQGDISGMQRIQMKEKVRAWLKKENITEKIPAGRVRDIERNLRPQNTSRTCVSAALVMVAIEDGIRVEDRRQANGRPPAEGSPKPRSWLKEAAEWAWEKGWLQSKREKKEMIKEGKKQVNEHPNRLEKVMIEFGSGPEGGTEGHRRVWDRVITQDEIATILWRDRKTVPEVLASFELYAKKKGGLVAYICKKTGVRKGELMAIWASPSCKEDSTGQGFQLDNEEAFGLYAGKERSEKNWEGLNAIVEGIKQAVEKDWKIQYCIENPGWSALRFEKMVTEPFGQGELEHGCAYGSSQNKPLRLWMSPTTARGWADVSIDPADPKSLCAVCKWGIGEHGAVGVPKRGDKRKREEREGVRKEAAKEMLPWRLTQAVSATMLKSYQLLRELHGDD